MKKKMYIWFFTFINDSAVVVGIKRISIKSKKVSYDGRSYVLDSNRSITSKRGKLLFFVDTSVGQVFLSKKAISEIIPAEVLDDFISTSIIKQMIAAVKPGGIWEKIMFMVLGVMAGCGLGFMLAGMV